MPTVGFLIVVLAGLFWGAPAMAARDGASGVAAPLPAPDFPVHKRRSDLARPARPAGHPYDGPIVDTHAHVMNRAEGGLDSILPRMDRAGVERLILSHTGMTNPANARALLQAYPDLMMNLKMVRPGGSLKWDQLEPISNADDRLYEDWARLMEDLPERFMVGTDARFGTRHYAGKRYGTAIAKLRRILGSLDRHAAELIAHANARRVFKATPAAAAATSATESPKPDQDRKRKIRKNKRKR